MNRPLKGKIALITGATSGIGKATALALAELGMDIIIVGRRAELLKSLQTEIFLMGVRCKYIKLDIRKANRVFRKIYGLDSSWANIDVLVNNAGLALGVEKVHNTPLDDFEAMIDTNIKGVFYMSKAVIPQMLTRKANGIIINIGSTAAHVSYPGGGVYCATKSAVKTLSDGLRIDLVDTPIRVSTVSPGLVETDFSLVRYKGDATSASKVYKNITSLTPEDVASTIAYICGLPDNVQIPEVIMTPTHQADSVHKFMDK